VFSQLSPDISPSEAELFDCLSKRALRQAQGASLTKPRASPARAPRPAVRSRTEPVLS
jgi:hypothetical protein